MDSFLVRLEPHLAADLISGPERKPLSCNTATNLQAALISCVICKVALGDSSRFIKINFPLSDHLFSAQTD